MLVSFYVLQSRENRSHSWLMLARSALSVVGLRHSLGLAFFSHVSSLRVFFVVVAVVVHAGTSMTTTPVPISSPETLSVVSDVAASASASQVGPSPLQSPLESRPSGRPKKSPVWEHFMIFSQTKAYVKWNNSTQSICGKSVAGKFPTNLKKHLKLAHPNVFQEITRKDEESKLVKVEKVSAKRAASFKYHHQSTLKESLAKKNPYSKDSPRYKLITQKLAIFVGSSSVANRIVENLEFRDLLSAMDERYPVPGRSSIQRELDQIMIELKANISAYIESANAVSITCDIWSKKGLTSSYLRVTAHFYSRTNNRCHTVTLAVRRLTTSHTASNIRSLLDNILVEWDILSSKVSAVITDNGSNMVAGFKANLDHFVVYETGNDEDEDEETADPCTQDETEDYLDHEIDHEVEFSSLNRIACFSHTLQLVVHKFDDVDRFKEVLKRTKALVRKVNTSTKATERLIALSGKKLIKDCPTRWSSMFLLINCLLEVREKLKVVLDELGWDDLAASGER